MEIDGLRLRVFVHDGRARGQGPTVVLIHGAGGNYLQWPPSLRRLPGMLVVAPDLPGHGDSAGNGFDRVGDYALTVRQLAAELGLQQIVLIGHSMGAAIALECGRLATDTVHGIGVLAGGAALPIPPDVVDGLRTDFAAATEGIARAAFGPSTPARRRELYLERLRQTDADVLYRDFVACREFDARPYVATLDVPAVIIAGEQDRLIPPLASKELHGLMPCSRLYTAGGRRAYAALGTDGCCCGDDQRVDRGRRGFIGNK